MPSGTVTLHRVLRAPPERIYRAFLDPDAMVKWLPPLADDRSVIEVEIDRMDDEIRIRPVRRSLAGVLKKFAAFSPDFMDKGRRG